MVKLQRREIPLVLENHTSAIYLQTARLQVPYCIFLWAIMLFMVNHLYAYLSRKVCEPLKIWPISTCLFPNSKHRVCNIIVIYSMTFHSSFIEIKRTYYCVTLRCSSGSCDTLLHCNIESPISKFWSTQ